MSISIYIEPKANSAELVRELLVQQFGIVDATSERLYQRTVKPHLDQLIDDLYLVAETNYIDRVYRDSYYNYYSSKLTKYKRDCIRISIFKGQVDNAAFRNLASHETLRKQYLGYFVLRPTEPYIIGRSIISPIALKKADFNCCVSKYTTTVNGVKMNVNGFPHSSQDTETITCAETTIWALMEYFGNHYPDYKPTMPSHIIETLKKVSSERQVPSKGLNIQQISFALKEYGFGTRIYAMAGYKHDFYPLLSCYIESGIPIVVAMQNRTGIAHALLCIGHESVTPAHIDNLIEFVPIEPELTKVITDKAIKLFDYDWMNKNFVFVDDNHPVYQTADLRNPAAHYPMAWYDCKITYFIAPLYTKIHLDAFEAKNFVTRFILMGPEPLSDNKEVLIRTYLTSSRSYKDKLSGNDTFPIDLRDIILETSMPKFIWIAELSTKELIKQKKAHGVLILDATEANIHYNKPLIIAAYEDKVINFEEDTGVLEKNNITLNEFLIFDNNLKNF